MKSAVLKTDTVVIFKISLPQLNFPTKRSTFAYSMSYIFGKLFNFYLTVHLKYLEKKICASYEATQCNRIEPKITHLVLWGLKPFKWY